MKELSSRFHIVEFSKQRRVKSNSIMNGKRFPINPTMSDLERGDPHLPEMISFLRHLVQGKTQREAAKNAALAYLALMTAFQQEGMVELEWVPSLAIDVGDIEYEVCFVTV